MPPVNGGKILYGQWARMCGLGTAWTLIPLGIATLDYPAALAGGIDPAPVGYICFIIAFLCLFPIEWPMPGVKTLLTNCDHFGYRGIAYILLSTPFWFVATTHLGALFMIITGALHIYAGFVNEERYELPPERKRR
eukprot:TRINITY_DN2089_c0_g1_i2.p1 TRINITY_DN2089_c0_g1~~TRINITY_DN2089_c0_g1_i2.p1  ORF type:complete len:136 (+),score=17.14 TRINITY_DN2089_c0_g1_i2:33-440(+)